MLLINNNLLLEEKSSKKENEFINSQPQLRLSMFSFNETTTMMKMMMIKKNKKKKMKKHRIYITDTVRQSQPSVSIYERKVS